MLLLLAAADFNVTSSQILGTIICVVVAILIILAVPYLLGLRYIANNRLGVIEKLWSSRGSLQNGRLIAMAGEAGYQAEVLRGGLHLFYWPWQYRIHSVPLTIVSQGKIGYVFARDGEPLRPDQMLARVVPCENFQDTRRFLASEGNGKPNAAGQRGRQRAILREGVYAINPAQFVVITEEHVYRLDRHDRGEAQLLDQWRQQLALQGGFDPIVIGGSDGSDEIRIEDETGCHSRDLIGIATVHDGHPLPPGQIIAPPPAGDRLDHDYQDVEAFLAAGGYRGRQLMPLTDGTYFINRWFANVEMLSKTIVPIGHVGVVVNYFGKEGHDVSGITFRHGERYAEGERGVQAKTMGPGKYAFNSYAGHVYLVPTTNFVLHWITGRTESHRYDESLKSIDLVTADAFEPVLPLSVVVHIDYQKAASVVQRFGDVKRLITQTLDPMLSAYFRDIAHKKTMLELLQKRDEIQVEARQELKERFAEFDIELVDVLIGKPDTAEGTGEIEQLLDQLRLRQLSREQVQTYDQQRAAAEKLKELKLAQALAEKQSELTNSQVQIKICENNGEAELAQGRKRAEQTVVDAEAEGKRRLLIAEAESKSLALTGEGEARRVALEGEAQARVLEQKILSYGDPRLFALSLVAQHLAQSRQPLVPRQLFVGGGGGQPTTSEQGMLGTLISLLVAEKVGIKPTEHANGRTSREVGSAS